jgi:hypothetical protein
MARPWIVSPHEAIVKLEPNLWVVEGKVPTPGGITRRMAIGRREDGGLWFFHAVPLDERTLAEVLAWGRPEALVVGHDQHCIDAEPFAKKLGVPIFGPGPNLAKLRARGLDIAPIDEMPRDSHLHFESMDGAKTGEPVFRVRSGDRVTLHFCDAIQNNPPDRIAFPLRWMGFGGGPKVVPAFRMLFTADRNRLRSHFARLAELPGLTRVVPFHGTIIDREPADALRRAATTI